MADRRPGVPGPEGPADPDGARPDGVAGGLRELGRALVVADPPADLAAAVLARVADEPAPRPSRWLRVRDRVVARSGQVRRIVVVAVVAVLLTLGVGSPAAARIAEWLGLGAVVVVRTPAPPALPAQPAPPAESPPAAGPVELSLPDARAAAPFALGVPAALGDPDRVQLTADHRVVTMTWAGRPQLRLDQVVGEPDPYFVKRYHDEIELVTVGGAQALWLSEPHPLDYVDPAGVDHLEAPRTAGPSLVWQRGTVTLRLEGEPDLAAALAVAESVR